MATLNCKLIGLIVLNIINIIFGLTTIVLGIVFKIMGFQQINIAISTCTDTYLKHKYSFIAQQVKTAFLSNCIALSMFIFTLMLLIPTLIKIKKLNNNQNNEENQIKNTQNQQKNNKQNLQNQQNKGQQQISKVLSRSKYGLIYISQTMGGLAIVVSLGYYITFLVDFSSQLLTCGFTFNPFQIIILVLLTVVQLILFIVMFFIILKLNGVIQKDENLQQTQNKYKQMVNMTQQPQNINNNQNQHNKYNKYNDNNNKYNDYNEQLYNSNLNTSNNRKNSIPSIFTLNMTQQHLNDNNNNNYNNKNNKDKQNYKDNNPNFNLNNNNSKPNTYNSKPNNAYNKNPNNYDINNPTPVQQKYLSPYERSDKKQTYQQYKQRQLRETRLKKLQQKNKSAPDNKNILNNNQNQLQHPIIQKNQFNQNIPKNNTKYFNQTSKYPNSNTNPNTINKTNTNQYQRKPAVLNYQPTPPAKNIQKSPAQNKGINVLKKEQNNDTRGQLLFKYKGNKSGRQNYDEKSGSIIESNFMREQQDYLKQNVRNTILPQKSNLQQSSQSRRYNEESYNNDSFKNTNFQQSRSKTRQGVLTSYIRGKFN